MFSQVLEVRSLEILIERVMSCLLLPRPAGGPALIALDHISTLDWIGFLLLELGCFLRALRAAFLKVCTTKATRYIAVLTTLLG